MGKITINVDWTGNYAASPVNGNVACVATGHTLDELKKNMTEALQFHIEGIKDSGMEIPEEFSDEWDIEWKLSTRALLHYTEGLVPRTAIAKATGINVQQLTHYASGWRHPRPEMQKRILDGIHKIGNELIAIS